ncbi:uncharacterized protein BYT42DRAFT_546893 [Radiomyces spectabilis]|uniref:uncharacterized protein n=1 Tax=Radiomyces spectabilis TaxID=64574 RepID=UPI0022204CD5|nr:uncharacterized protein BYT42DRAFT_546893 [Radiomyces spectabilis]KAI8376181.1 hypothetical protein BYT42DRAFT_546893 [Radiomyces spectabilis]
MSRPVSHVITAESFTIRTAGINSTRKRTRGSLAARRPVRRKRNLAAQVVCPPPRPTIDESDQEVVVSNPQLAMILNGAVIFFDRTLIERQRLSRQALALGAQVVEEIDHATLTHIVHAPSMVNGVKQRHPRFVLQALERNIRVVSPLWIRHCFDEKQKLPEAFFPYDIDAQNQHRQLIDLQNRPMHTTIEDDNPFHIDEEELISSDSDANDDEKVSVHENDSVRGESPLPVMASDHAHGTTPVPVPPLERSESPLATLSTATSSVTHEEDPEKSTRRKKRAEDIRKILERVRVSRQSREEERGDDALQSSLIKPYQKVQLPDAQGKLKIWYGEQTIFYNDTPTSMGSSKTLKRSRGTTGESSKKRSM